MLPGNTGYLWGASRTRLAGSPSLTARAAGPTAALRGSRRISTAAALATSPGRGSGPLSATLTSVCAIHPIAANTARATDIQRPGNAARSPATADIVSTLALTTISAGPSALASCTTVAAGPTRCSTVTSGATSPMIRATDSTISACPERAAVAPCPSGTGSRPITTVSAAATPVGVSSLPTIGVRAIPRVPSLAAIPVLFIARLPVEPSRMGLGAVLTPRIVRAIRGSGRVLTLAQCHASQHAHDKDERDDLPCE